MASKMADKSLRAQEEAPSLAETLLERQYLLFPISFVVLIAVWEGTINYFEIDEFLLPAPSGIAMALLRGLFFVDSGGAAAEAADFMNLMQNSFYNHISHTLFEAVMGFFMGSFIGRMGISGGRWAESIRESAPAGCSGIFAPLPSPADGRGRSGFCLVTVQVLPQWTTVVNLYAHCTVFRRCRFSASTHSS